MRNRGSFLVTGADSGFGKYGLARFGGVPFTRRDSIRDLRGRRFDVVLHCAANTARVIDSTNLAGYLRDNLFLTMDLLTIPCRKFVYMSSVDVYPKDGEAHGAGEQIDLEGLSTAYSITKRASEMLINEKRPDSLILRCSSLLGPTMRPNTITRIIDESPVEVGLREDSSYNLVLYSDVADFIERAVAHGLAGTFDIVSSENVLLKDLAMALGNQVKFGSYRYDAGCVDNSAAANIVPALKRESLDTFNIFARERRRSR